ncbi:MULTISPECIES: protein-export chaperone SecB [Niveibacterium]|uniref:Protein-export protein SecB n=1 Tax=Niveibacterium microcysteis TaxID=2811415 RepID=A0ABX7M992_9RHOO|nr:MULTISPECIES: protein-export chaperone SecB [Niveibacterium]QSI78293.1 protein-export chaperone SecB [Niveibacterium microcysteis]
MSEQAQPVFSIEKLYVKDLSIEVPNAPQIFLEREAPQIAVELNTAANKVDDGYYNVVVNVTVKATSGEKTVFLVEVAQCGVFQIRNFAEADVQPVTMIGCANILFPYAREAVSDAITRAGFQPILLAPVNFEALYQARQEQQQAAGSDVVIQ